MNKFLTFFLLVAPAVFQGQHRQLLKCKAISDEYKAVDVTVKNLAAETTVVTDEEGNFSIEAAVGDILEFSSLTFKKYTHSLKPQDFREELFVIRLEPLAIILDEIKIVGMTGNLAIDSKKLAVDKLFNKEFDASVINLNVVPENPLGNMNFMAIFGMLADAVSPSKPKPKYRERGYYPTVHRPPFSVVVQQNYPLSFFTYTVQIPKEKLALFLHFCNQDAKLYLLDPKNEADLIIFLKNKYTLYLNQPENNEN